jgi:hypothetical protein
MSVISNTDSLAALLAPELLQFSTTDSATAPPKAIITEPTVAAELTQSVENEPESEQTEPKQTEPKQTEPEQTELEQTELEQTELEQTEPEQTEPEQTEATTQNGQSVINEEAGDINHLLALINTRLSAIENKLNFLVQSAPGLPLFN